MSKRNKFDQELVKIFNLLIVVILIGLFSVAFTFYWYIDPELTLLNNKESSPQNVKVIAAPQIVDGIHVASGFKEGIGLEVVITNCTACHSAKLVTQNRASKEGWKNMIRWMQETQGLWPLGDNEEVILNYLAKNYVPGKVGRRANLKDIEWYEHKP